MLKNTAGQKIRLFAFDYSTGAPKTGDAANITAYVSKSNGTPTVLADTSATEVDSTKAPGMYDFDVAQAESNDDDLLFTGKSTTANVTIVPVRVTTRVDVGYVSGVAQSAADIAYYFLYLFKRINTAQSGTATTIKLDASSAATHCDVGDIIWLTSGAGTGQANTVQSFDATTKIATISGTWNQTIGNPGLGTSFVVLRGGGIAPGSIYDVWSDSVNPGRTITAGNVSKLNGTTITGLGTVASPWRGA